MAVEVVDAFSLFKIELSRNWMVVSSWTQKERALRKGTLLYVPQFKFVSKIFVQVNTFGENFVKILCKYQQFYDFVKNPSQDSSFFFMYSGAWWLIGKGRQLDWNKGAFDMLPSRWTPSSKYYLYAMFITFINSYFYAFYYFLHDCCFFFIFCFPCFPKIWMCEISPLVWLFMTGETIEEAAMATGRVQNVSDKGQCAWFHNSTLIYLSNMQVSYTHKDLKIT